MLKIGLFKKQVRFRILIIPAQVLQQALPNETCEFLQNHTGSNPFWVNNWITALQFINATGNDIAWPIVLLETKSSPNKQFPKINYCLYTFKCL